MTHSTGQVKPILSELVNVAPCLAALRDAMIRDANLPGLVVFHGPSGWGKSSAAAIAQQRTNAYYVEARSVWTKKGMLTSILKAMGILPKGTITDLFDAVAEQLARSGRPLILDEADYLVAKNLVQIARDLHDASQTPIMFIGEEDMPRKLKQIERVDNRVKTFVEAQPTDLDDARLLASHYCAQLEIKDNLLERVIEAAGGAARRVCVNLSLIQEQARLNNWASVDLETWGNRPLYAGAPSGRWGR